MADPEQTDDALVLLAELLRLEWQQAFGKLPEPERRWICEPLLPGGE